MLRYFTACLNDFWHGDHCIQWRLLHSICNAFSLLLFALFIDIGLFHFLFFQIANICQGIVIDFIYWYELRCTFCWVSTIFIYDFNHIIHSSMFYLFIIFLHSVSWSLDLSNLLSAFNCTVTDHFEVIIVFYLDLRILDIYFFVPLHSYFFSLFIVWFFFLKRRCIYERWGRLWWCTLPRFFLVCWVPSGCGCFLDGLRRFRNISYIGCLFKLVLL